MSCELEGKVAIVTGAATGIGKAIALAFAPADARVVVNHLDTPDLADAGVAQISRDAPRRSLSGTRHEQPWRVRDARARGDRSLW